MFPPLFLKSRTDDGGGAPPPAFDATTDATLLCEEGNYAAAAGNGTFTATVGSNLAHATLAPAAAAGAPDFDGATTQLTGPLPTALGLTGAAHSGLLAYTIDSSHTDSGAYYNNDGFWGDVTDGYTAVSVGDNGDGTVTIYYGVTCADASTKVATQTVTAAGRHVVHWKYAWNGAAGSICVGVDGSWGTPVALTAAIDPLVNGHVVNFGRNYAGTKRLDGREHSIAFYNVVKDDTFIADWIGAYG